MDVSGVVEWALYLGLAVVMFTSLTGFDEAIAKLFSKSPTRKELANKVLMLEQRVRQLEAGKD